MQASSGATGGPADVGRGAAPAALPPAGPGASPRRSRRDRHGRGLRRPLLPGTLPAARTRGERVADLVVAAVDRLEPRWGPHLAAVDVEVADIPPRGPAAARATAPLSVDGDVLLADHRRATRHHPAVVVVYRRPVELRAPDRPARVDLLRDLVAEQLGEILGVPPGELDPDYDDGE